MMLCSPGRGERKGGFPTPGAWKLEDAQPVTSPLPQKFLCLWQIITRINNNTLHAASVRMKLSARAAGSLWRAEPH